jgi:aminobenzoyl-glutamate transport protein
MRRGALAGAGGGHDTGGEGVTGAAGSPGVAAPRKKSFLDTVERIGNRLPDPVLIFLWLIVAVVAMSAVGAVAGWAAVNPVTQATLNATSLLSSANLERFLVEMPRTLTGFAPLGYVLLVMLGAGIAERTGLFGAAMRSIVRLAPARLLTPIVLFAGVMGNQAADAAFVILPPLAAALYAAAGRHPLLGIAVAFAGVAGGFSANLLPGGLDALLLGLTEPAARLLDPDWRMNIAGNWYFIAAMTLVFIPLGWWVTETIVGPRLGPWTGPLQPSTVSANSPPGMAPGAAGPTISTADEKRGLRAAMIAGAVVVALFAVLAWPALWAGVTGGAPLYDESVGPDGRIEQGLQPLFQALVAGFFLLFLVTGIAYGRATGVNKTHRDEIRMISEGMTDMAYYIVLAFVAAHFVALFNWSNLGGIFAIKGAAALASTGLPTPVLLVGIVLLAATINLGIGSASAKWAMLAPVLVPMLMLLNVSPEMTTAAFRMGDSVTNPITPLMVYFPLVLTFCQRWDPRFGMGGLIATMLPFSLMFLLAGLAMTFGWAALQWPLGPGAEVSYTIPLQLTAP